MCETDGGQQVVGVLDVGGGLLDGTAGCSLSPLSFFECSLHLLCRVLHICRLLTNGHRKSQFASFHKFSLSDLNVAQIDHSLDVSWVG